MNIYQAEDRIAANDLVSHRLPINNVPNFLEGVLEVSITNTPRIFLDGHEPNHGRDKDMEPAVVIQSTSWEVDVRDLPCGLPCVA